MAERPRFFDDLAGVAGGAMSALVGLRDEAEALVRARVDEALRKLDLVRREEVDAATEMAARARSGQEDADRRLDEALARIATLEHRVAALEDRPTAETSGGPAASAPPGGGGPGMIA